VALLLLAGLVADVLLGRVTNAQDWLVHTREVQLKLAQARSLLTAAETAQRGYLITGETQLLTPFRSAQPALHTTVTEIAELTKDNPRQQARVPDLQAVVAQRMAALADVLHLAEAGRPADAAAMVRSGPGHALMVRASALLDEMEAEEDRLLQARLLRVEQESTAARWMLGALTLTGTVLLLGLHRSLSRSERRLRDSAELTRALVDHAPAYVRLHSNGNDTPLENRLYRQARQNDAALAGWLDRQLHEQEAQARARGQPVLLRASTTEANGTRHFQGASFPVMSDDGRLLGVGSFLTDVSALEQARAELEALTHTLEQQVLQRTARLTEANAELEAFSYMVSHDLRAPLRAVQGFATALMEDAGAKLSEGEREFLHRILTAAGRMDRLIEDLLGYGRLSRVALAIQPVALDAVLDRALAALAADIDTTGASVQVQRPLPVVQGQATVLAQVFQNLLANALKFVAPGTRPEVQVEAVDTAAGSVKVMVRDNGIGIAAQDQARIFTAFERLHGEERYAGSGIGLAVVKKGVERLGGQVGVHSTPGRGSCFWIELPRWGSEPLPAASASKELAP